MSARRIALAGAVAAGLLAACSSDDPEGTGPKVTFITTPPRATEPGETTPPDVTDPATTTDDGTDPPATTPLGDPQMKLEEIATAPIPVDLAIRPGDDTLYVVGQDGTVVPIRDGVAGAPVLDISPFTNAQSEQGFLGLAFHPTLPLAYVNYINSDQDTIIDEFAVNDDGTFDPSSQRLVLEIDQPYANHNGGGLAFGPDGYLYIGTGDGGDANDPERRALNVSELLGKMLRIDPVAADGQPYTVPDDNPFIGVSGARPEIWSVGLRNPWRFSFDRETGDFWIADVGQGALEEIDVAWADEGGGRGLNFGWSAFEGTRRANDDQPADGVTPPIFEYEHGDLGCSISGGALYRGTAIPALVGWYVYADYCSGQVRALQIADRAVVKELTFGTESAVTAVREGPDGELYVLSGDGPVYAIRQA